MPTLPTAHPGHWSFTRTGRDHHVEWDSFHAHSGAMLDAVYNAGTQADGYLPSGNRISCFNNIRSHYGKVNPACDSGIPRTGIDIRAGAIPSHRTTIASQLSTI